MHRQRLGPSPESNALAAPARCCCCPRADRATRGTQTIALSIRVKGEGTPSEEGVRGAATEALLKHSPSQSSGRLPRKGDGGHTAPSALSFPGKAPGPPPQSPSQTAPLKFIPQIHSPRIHFVPETPLPAPPSKNKAWDGGLQLH